MLDQKQVSKSDRISNFSLQPRKRSKFRSFAGKAYYKALRYMLWYSGHIKYASNRSMQNLQYTYFSHKTPLLRKLRDVDMQYQFNKIINLRLAVEKLDGIILSPGETFSYWRLIGKPSAKKGYVPGMVLHCGKFRMGIGGGLCQLSNLIYWMTLHTPLTIVERYRHSYDVFPDSNRTQPFGTGATCVYPYRDLMIRNDTDAKFQLHVMVGDEFLEGRWLSDQVPEYRYEIVEKNHHFKPEFWGGFSRHNEIWRNCWSTAGSFICEEFITENHALMMYSPLLPPSGQPM
jgi:vancomycin resistance protein VanW